MISRRSFLTMLGLAPIAATIPTVAKSESPFIVDEPGFKLSKPGRDVFEGANIGTINAGTIRSKDKRFVMDLSNGTLRWNDFIGES